MLLKCPVCSQALLQVPLHNRASHICARKHGRAFATSAVRKWLVDEARAPFDEALLRSILGARSCPRCNGKMKVLHFNQGLKLDHCESCSLTWFDKGEHEAMPHRSAEEIEKENPVASAEMEFRLHFRPGLSPYENIKGETSKFPIVTIILILVCTIVTHFAMGNQYRGFIFNAGEPFQALGISALLSIFAHGSFTHLVNNVFFFFFPGTLLESTFGEKVLLQVFFLCGLAALVTDAIFFPNTFSLGASAAISGVYTVLCLTQPQAMLVTQSHGLVLMSFYTITRRVPVWAIYLLWMSSQLVGAHHQLLGRGNGIGYIAHVVGAMMGVVYVFSTDLKLLSTRASGKE